MKHSKRIPSGATLSVIETLVKIINKYHKNYCTPSQEHILRLLKKYHGIEIARSTLNVWLKYLADDHWIKRYRRHYRNDCGKPVFLSTAYYIQQKAINYLNSLRNWAQNALRLSRVRFYGQHMNNTNKILSLVSSFPIGTHLIEERDGTVSRYHPVTGEYAKIS